MLNKNVNHVLSGSWHQWGGEDIKKWCRRVNVRKYYVLMNENGKVRPAETIPGMGGERIKENDVRYEVNYDVL
jgi:hypothetical protein